MPSIENKEDLRKLMRYYDDFWSANFDTIAQEYGKPFLREKRCLISKLLDVGPKDVVLDLGCGNGLSLISASKCRLLLSVDISMVCLRPIKKLRGEVSFINSIAENTALKPNSVDKIICAELMEHVIDDVKVLREIHRILKPSGTVVFNIPNGYSFFYWPKRIVRLLLSRLKLKERYEEGQTYWENIGEVAHLRRYSKKMFTSRLSNNGFTVNRCVGLFIDNGNRFNALMKPLSNNFISYGIFTSISKLFPSMGRELIVVCKKTPGSKSVSGAKSNLCAAYPAS